MNSDQFLPTDSAAATLVGRVWLPASGGSAAGPRVVELRDGLLHDLSAYAPTMADLLSRA